MGVADIGRWCVRHILLLWAALHLIAVIAAFAFLEPSQIDGLPAPLLFSIFVTSTLFFFVYDAIKALGVPVSAQPIVFGVVMFVILAGADLAIHLLRRGKAGASADAIGRSVKRYCRWLLRHIVLVWGLLLFVTGVATIGMDLQYDGGGLETLTFFIFWYANAPAQLAQWILQSVGVDFSPRWWPYASLSLALLICAAVDVAIGILLRRARRPAAS